MGGEKTSYPYLRWGSKSRKLRPDTLLWFWNPFTARTSFPTEFVETSQVTGSSKPFGGQPFFLDHLRTMANDPDAEYFATEKAEEELVPGFGWSYSPLTLSWESSNSLSFHTSYLWSLDGRPGGFVPTASPVGTAEIWST